MLFKNRYLSGRKSSSSGRDLVNIDAVRDLFGKRVVSVPQDLVYSALTAYRAGRIVLFPDPRSGDIIYVKVYLRVPCELISYLGGALLGVEGARVADRLADQIDASRRSRDLERVGQDIGRSVRVNDLNVPVARLLSGQVKCALDISGIDHHDSFSRDRQLSRSREPHCGARQEICPGYCRRDNGIVSAGIRSDRSYYRKKMNDRVTGVDEAIAEPVVAAAVHAVPHASGLAVQIIACRRHISAGGWKSFHGNIIRCAESGDSGAKENYCKPDEEDLFHFDL